MLTLNHITPPFETLQWSTISYRTKFKLPGMLARSSIFLHSSGSYPFTLSGSSHPEVHLMLLPHAWCLCWSFCVSFVTLSFLPSLRAQISFQLFTPRLVFPTKQWDPQGYFSFLSSVTTAWQPLSKFEEKEGKIFWIHPLYALTTQGHPENLYLQNTTKPQGDKEWGQN